MDAHSDNRMETSPNPDATAPERPSQPSSNTWRPGNAAIGTLAQTINRAIEQAEQLGLPAATRLLMMARLEVDLSEIAIVAERNRSQPKHLR